MWANTSGLFRDKIFIWQILLITHWTGWNMYRHHLSYKVYPQQNRHKNEVNVMDKIMVLRKVKCQIYFWWAFPPKHVLKAENTKCWKATKLNKCVLSFSGTHGIMLHWKHCNLSQHAAQRPTRPSLLLWRWSSATFALLNAIAAPGQLFFVYITRGIILSIFFQ